MQKDLIKKLTFILLMGTCLSASGITSFEDDETGFWDFKKTFITFSVGREQILLSDNTDKKISYSATYEFKPRSTSAFNNFFGVDLGAELYQSETSRFTVALGYYQPQGVVVAGNYSSQLSPSSSIENSNYKYNISLKQFILESKFFVGGVGNIETFISGGAGLTMGRLYGYSLSQLDSAALTFPNNQDKKFTYTFGGGINLMLSEQVQLTLSYRYSHFGSFETKSGIILDETINQTLKQANLNAHQILIQTIYYW